MISAPNRQDLRGRLRDLEEGDSPKTRMEDFEALKEYLQVVAYSETMIGLEVRGRVANESEIVCIHWSPTVNVSNMDHIIVQMCTILPFSTFGAESEN